MTRRLISVSLTALLAAWAAAPAAHAGGASGIVVSFADLDLGTGLGRAELNHRLMTAAGSLCSPVLALDNPGSEQSIREHQILYRACVGRLTGRALAKIDARP